MPSPWCPLDICSWVLGLGMLYSLLGTCQHLLCVPEGVWAEYLGWVEVVVMVVVVVLMVVMVFMPLDHRHHVALGP